MGSIERSALNRRNFARLGGAWTLGALAPGLTRAQQPPPPRVVRLGVLTRTSPEQTLAARWWRMAAAMLNRLGWTEGRNLAIDIRVGADPDSLRAAASSLVAASVDALFADGNIAASEAVRVTRTVPIVMLGAGIVELGFAESLARPGGNVTGVELQTYDACGKCMSHLRSVRPGLARIGMPLTRGLQLGEAWYRSWERVAAPIGVSIAVLPRLLRPEDVAAMLDAGSREQAQALVMPNLPFLAPADWARIQAWAVERQVVTLGSVSDVGAVMLAFGASMTEVAEIATGQLNRVLRGAHPADVPIIQPTRFDLMVNRRFASDAGWPIPNEVLLQATAVLN